MYQRFSGRLILGVLDTVANCVRLVRAGLAPQPEDLARVILADLIGPVAAERHAAAFATAFIVHRLDPGGDVSETEVRVWLARRTAAE